MSTMFSQLEVVFIWSGGLSSEVELLVLSFLRLSNSLKNLLLCRFLAVLYARYLWERIWDAASGEN